MAAESLRVTAHRVTADTPEALSEAAPLALAALTDWASSNSKLLTPPDLTVFRSPDFPGVAVAVAEARTVVH